MRLKRQEGVLLVEAIVAVAVLGLTGTAVLAGLSTSKISGANTSTHSVAENLSRNQMESVFAEAYQGPAGSYTLVGTPSGYTVTVASEEYVVSDSNLELLTIRIFHQGAEVSVLETLRSRP